MKIGDKVECVKVDVDLEVGGIYTIVKSTPYWEDDKSVICLNIDGNVIPYYKSYFKPIKPKVLKTSTNTLDTIKKQVELAESFIGQTVSMTKDLTKKHRIGNTSIVFTEKQAREYSHLVIREFEKSGFCVVVSGHGWSFPVVDVVLNKSSETIKLTKDYDILIEKDKVTVGCQVIPRSKMIEIHNIMESFQ